MSSIPPSSCLNPLESLPEYDEKIRNCYIKLYTRPVKNQKPTATTDQNEPDIKQLPSDENKKTFPSFIVSFHHWALVADFGPHDRQLTFEAGDDGNGYIKATRTQGVMAGATNAFHIGTVETSPMKLLELAKKHPFNGTMYLLAFHNCQNWVKEFAKMIDPNLLTKLENIDSCDKAIIKKGALAVSSAGLLTSSVSLKNKWENAVRSFDNEK